MKLTLDPVRDWTGQLPSQSYKMAGVEMSKAELVKIQGNLDQSLARVCRSFHFC